MTERMLGKGRVNGLPGQVYGYMLEESFITRVNSFINPMSLQKWKRHNELLESMLHIIIFKIKYFLDQIWHFYCKCFAIAEFKTGD
jgi:hypothetical protein